jgi:putative DNA primase/helicase
MCSLDIDCEESFQALLAEFGLPAEDLDQYPCIEGRGRRIMFRVPDGVELPYCKLNWPTEGNPSKKYTVVEFRASGDGKQRQDVLPPTVHPDTGKAYKWIVQPPKSGEWPTPPDWLIAVWSAWSAFKPQFVDACPWAEKKPEPQRPAQPSAPSSGGSVIDAYIQATPLTQALSNYGYTKKGSRWLSPHSGTGIPGVHMYSDGIRCYIHHASDPLCSEENGQPVNAFDLFRYYEHNDDVKAAVKAAAELLGLQTKRQQPAPPMPAAPVPADPEPEMTPVEQIERDGDAQHQHSPEFQCLGYNGNYIYVLPRRSEQVARLSYGSLTKTALLQIACLEWWGAEFPKKDGVDWEMAVNTVLRWCENKGIYDARNERGRGAWYDGGRPVLHLGTSLIIDGKHKAISEHHSRYIYTKQAALENAFDAAPVGDAEAKRLADIFEGLNWSRKEHGLLALGWTVLAPVCGALSWRPHLWLTAQRGAGKTWVQSYVMKPVIGEETLVHCQGGTTEAGIRHALKHDARPVMFDEAESEDASAARRMQSVLELARQSSSDSGAEIVKGTANGDGMSFNIRAMFMLGSINVGLKQAADESRFSVVSLARPTKAPGEAERFAEFERHVLATLTPEYCAGIRSRTYHAIPVIRKNTKVMAQAVAEELGSQRMGDQIGTLLAGAYSLLSSELITIEQAKAYIKGMNFDEAGEAEEVSDEHNCLNAILQRQVRVDFSGHGSMTKSIGELVDDCYNLPVIDTKEERLTLGRHGLRVEGDELWVANSHAELTKTLRDTPWGSGHKRMLMRINGAIGSDKSAKFAGSGSRYVSIPIVELV